ncbi:hypothetical protein B0H13DRAFT_2389217 [Mycena leptocephala]|nr:hypothetical protein B0H13DRAFT_2389217 [Mycena leptocephala]
MPLLCGFSVTLSTVVAQEYFAHTLFSIHKRKILYPLFVALLGVASLGAGIAQTTILFTVHTLVDIEKTSSSLTAQAATALACIQSTNKLINFLIMFTMVFAILNIVLWLTKPDAFYFLMINIMRGKCTWRSITSYPTQVLKTTLGSANFAMNSSTLHEPRARMEPIGVNVSVAKEILRDRVDDTRYMANHDGGAFS